METKYSAHLRQYVNLVIDCKFYESQKKCSAMESKLPLLFDSRPISTTTLSSRNYSVNAWPWKQNFPLSLNSRSFSTSIANSMYRKVAMKTKSSVLSRQLTDVNIHCKFQNKCVTMVIKLPLFFDSRLIPTSIVYS